MNRPIAKLTKLPRDRWRQLLLQSEGGSYFSSPEWAEATAEQVGGYAAGWLLSVGSFEYLVSGVVTTGRSGLRHISSMPYGTYPGVVPINGAPRHTALVVDGMRRALAPSIRLGRVELRFGTGWESAPGLDSHETHCVDLRGGSEAVWAAMSQSTRRDAGQAERRGVAVSEAYGEEAYRGLYHLIEQSLPTWGLSKPPYPWELFSRVSQHNTQDGSLLVPRLWQATFSGIPLAYALVYYGKQEAFYWAGATDRNQSRYLGGALLQWHIMRHAIELQVKTYNMGSSGDLEGVRRFKEGFGALPRIVSSAQFEGPLLSGARSVQNVANSVRQGLRSLWPLSTQ